MKEGSMNILIVEDDPAYVRFIKEILKESGQVKFELIHVKRLDAAMKSLKRGIFDAVLLDLNLPDSLGFDTFLRLHEKFPLVPVIVLTGVADEETGVKAVQKGAQDYLSKGEVESNLLARTILYAIERKGLMEELERSYQKFYNLSAHLQYLREEERKLIAGELHDELGGLFTAMKMELSSPLNNIDEREDALSEMKNSLAKLIDTGIDIVRRISTDLRPHILDHLGLMPAINWYIKEFQKRAGMRCKWVICGGEIPMDKDRATAVFRVLQEALTNVARHSKASRVTVELLRDGDTMKLKIEDNGVGIHEEKVNDPRSFGLIGIQERVLYLKGQVTIKGVPHKGTTVAVTIPLLEMGEGKNDQGDYRR